jgi:murein DD-endopeptidase MepM/ murein hydrolase activator NlpD
MRRGEALVVFVLVGGSVAMSFAGSGPIAGAKTDPVAQAAVRVKQARQAANTAAANYAAAETRYEKLGDDVTSIDARIKQTESEASTYRAAAQARAVKAYRSGRSTPGSADPSDALDAATRRALLKRVNARDNASASRLRSIEADLDSQRALLKNRGAEQQRALEQLRSVRRQLDAKLGASQKALAVQQSLAANLRRQAAARSRSRRTGDAGGQIVVNANGRAWTCPVPSAAFTNDWGQPRSGGRHHQGTDLFAGRGAANVAVVAGSVGENSGGLGGTAALLQGDDGNQYYYAHLSEIVGGARRVSQGELIGRTGNSGNARGGPTHTHFEIRIGGRRVNPYPTLRTNC